MQSHCQLAYPICVHWVYFPTMRPQWGHVSPLLGQHIQHMNISLQVSSPKYLVSIYIYIYIYCVHVYLHNIDWRHSYNIYIYIHIYCTYTHIHIHVPVSCINTSASLSSRAGHLSIHGSQALGTGASHSGHPLVNWQFANWKITIFNRGW